MSHASPRVTAPHIIHVPMTCRADFDRIAAKVWDWTRCEDPQPLLTKEVTDGTTAVIFEHWLQHPDDEHAQAAPVMAGLGQLMEHSNP